MYQEPSPPSRQSSELVGYGNLSDFDPQAARRAKEPDEQDLIDSIMGGENFHVGDGTLEFKLRDEDRDLISHEPVHVLTSVTHAPDAQPVDQDFAPIEAGYPDPGDEVARTAVHDALLRLEAIADGRESEEDAPNNPVDAINELSEVGTDELLSGLGGMGSDLESDTPSPFTLPKVPDSYEQFIPQTSEVLPTPQPFSCSDQGSRIRNRVLQALRERQRRGGDNGADGNLAGIESDEIEDAETRAFREPEPMFADDFGAKSDAIESTVESMTDDFAPFEQRVEADSEATLDSRQAATPSYARSREKERNMSSASSAVIDNFLPPSAAKEPTAVGQRREFTREVPPMPSYSQSRQPIEQPEAFDFERHGRAHTEEESREKVVHETPEEESYQKESAEEPPVSARPSLKSFIRQNWIVMVAGVLIAGLVGYNQVKKMPADGESAPATETVETLRTPQMIVTEDVESDASPVNQPPAVADPANDALVSGATAPTIVEAKLTDLATRMSALESERDQLRAENESLKKKSGAKLKSAANPVKKRAEPTAEVTEAVAAPARKALSSIQYLGTFSDGNRLVAEVLINGRLLRIKRGDLLAGDLRVNAVADMSVTIDESVYSP